MPTPVLISGPHHGVVSTLGGGLLTVLNQTSATLDLVDEDSRTWWRWTQNESNGAFGYAALPRAASAQNRGCVSVYIKIVALPGLGEVRLVGLGTRESNDLAQFGIDSTGAARLVTSANSDPQTGPTLSINTVYRVELEYDRSTTTATARCRIYDDAGTQVGSEMVAAVSGTIANVVQDVVIQVYGSGLNSLGAVVLLRDLVFCQGAEYPLGPHVVEGKVVAAVGTHSLDATPSAHFYQHDGATETALTTSETTSFQRIDERPLDGGSDRVGVKAAGGSPQFADPVGNGAQTAWTNTWTNVDDAVRDPNDGDNATISSSTDEAAEDIVFGNTITYEAGATYQLKVRGAGGAKRAIDLQFSVNDGTSFGTRSQIIATGAAEAWVTVDITSLITGQTALDQMRARFICNSTGGGGGASAVSIDAVYVEKIPAVTQPADTRYAEYELEDSANTEDPWGLTVYAAFRNESGTATNLIRTKLAEGGSESDLFNGLSIGSASLTYRSATRATKPSGGAWTDAAWDATTLRFGYTNDADPSPRLDAVVFEVAFPLAAAITEQLGPGLETDSAGTVARAKTKALAASTLLETAGSLGRVKLRALGAAAESESPAALSRQKIRQTAAGLELDTAGAVTVPAPIVVELGPALETDSSEPVGRRKLRALATGSEAGLAGAVGRARSRQLGAAGESSLSGALGRLKSRLLPAAADTSSAGAIGRSRARALGAPAATDLASPLSRRKERSVGTAVEAELPGDLAVQRARALGPAQEADSAGSLAARKQRPIGAALDTSVAGSLVARKVRQLLDALEASAAGALARTKRQLISAAAEADEGGPLAGGATRELGPALEASSAAALGRLKRRSVAAGLEADTAGPLGREKRRPAGFAEESSAATPVGAHKLRLLGAPATSDEPGSFAPLKLRLLGPGAETDVAGIFSQPVAYASGPGTITARIVLVRPAAGIGLVMPMAELVRVGRTAGLVRRSPTGGVVLVTPTGDS